MCFLKSDPFRPTQFHLKRIPDYLLQWFEGSDSYLSWMRFVGYLHLSFSRSDSFPIRKKNTWRIHPRFIGLPFYHELEQPLLCGSLLKLLGLKGNFKRSVKLSQAYKNSLSPWQLYDPQEHKWLYWEQVSWTAFSNSSEAPLLELLVAVKHSLRRQSS